MPITFRLFDTMYRLMLDGQRYRHRAIASNALHSVKRVKTVHEVQRLTLVETDLGVAVTVETIAGTRVYLLLLYWSAWDC